MNPNSRPFHEIKLGRIRASIWRNEKNQHGFWFSVSLTRYYKDGNQWKTTSTFGRDDLPLAAKAAEMAYAWIWNFTSKEQQTNGVR